MQSPAENTESFEVLQNSSTIIPLLTSIPASSAIVSQGKTPIPTITKSEITLPFEVITSIPFSFPDIPSTDVFVCISTPACE